MPQTKGKIKRDFTQGPILKGMVLFAIPLILSGILQQFFHTADTVMVGRWGGETPEECERALGSVGSCSHLITTIVALFTGLGTGTSVCVARELGAKDYDGVRNTVRTSLTASLVCGIGCMLFGILGARPLLTLMGTDAALLDTAVLYMRAYFLGIPASIAYGFCSAALTASGDSVRPLIFLSSAGVVNVGLNALFIIGFGMGAIGVGLATALSNWFSLCLILVYMSLMKGYCRIPWRNLGIDWKKLGKLLRIGVPASIQGAMFAFSNVFTQSAINGFGAATVAGNTSAASIETYLAFVESGVSQSGSVYVGQNAGAKDFARVKRALLLGLLLTFCVDVVIGGAICLFAEPLLRIFLPEGDASISAGMTRILILIATHFLYGIIPFGTSSLRGMGKNLLPTAMMIGGCCIFRILWILLIYTPFFEGNLVWLYMVYPASWILTASAVCTSLFFVYRKLAREAQALKDEKPAVVAEAQ